MKIHSDTAHQIPSISKARFLFATSLTLFGLTTSCVAPKSNYSTPEYSAHGSVEVQQPYGIDDWWPNRLDLRVLKENAPSGDPMDDDFNYAIEFSKLDYEAVKKDIETTLRDSKEWWPADWGHYGGLMIRLAWHSAGTYRSVDGRGGSASGTIRFAPLNSWPDNANLDKARRLLWPVKKKYGTSLSWADLMILTGNVAFESMGFETFGFGGGREDVYEPTDINWGPETEWLADQRFDESGNLQDKLGASQMGLIYVNPQGPGGNPDPLLAAEHIRITFGRMGMNDEETVALIAGGHTLGKAHGATKPDGHVGPEPEGASLEEQGMGWKNSYGEGKGKDTITSGIEGAWTKTPTSWSHDYFVNLYEFEWELIEGPGGAKQWEPKGYGDPTVPDAHEEGKFHKPMMLTTDLALKEDAAYGEVSKRFYEHPEEFNLAFAKAWYKLTHRDMGPQTRLLGPEVAPAQIWQDPVPVVNHPLVGDAEVEELKGHVRESGLTTAQLVMTAWASASTYRDTDKRGGSNGARIQLAPQKDWEVNQPTELATVLSKLSEIQSKFNDSREDEMRLSMADLIVLAGGVAVENAAAKGGYAVSVPFNPGRMDATQEMTDEKSFEHLSPPSDGFRNYAGKDDSQAFTENMVNHADLLTLTAPEMTVLVGGMRTLGATHANGSHGVFTDDTDMLTNDFFVTLMDMGVEWSVSEENSQLYEAKDRKSGEVVRTATAADMVFGSNSQLRALVEVYAADDAKEKFTQDFVAAWAKVMELDRFDLKMNPK